MKLTDVIRRPLITEKTSHPPRGRPDARLPGRVRRQQDRDQARRRAAARREGGEHPHQHRARQDQAAGPVRGPAARLEEGVRDAPRGPEDARIPGRRVKRVQRHADSQVQPDVARPAVPDGPDVRRHHDVGAAQAAGRAAARVGRPQQPRPADVVVARRRPQADVPHHRLQARQARHPGEGLDDRVRPEPIGAHRAPDLRRRREALHPPADRAEGRRHDRRRARTSTSCRATRCR